MYFTLLEFIHEYELSKTSWNTPSLVKGSVRCVTGVSPTWSWVVSCAGSVSPSATKFVRTLQSYRPYQCYTTPHVSCDIDNTTTPKFSDLARHFHNPFDDLSGGHPNVQGERITCSNLYPRQNRLARQWRGIQVANENNKYFRPALVGMATVHPLVGVVKP